LTAKKVCANPRIWAGASPKSKCIRRFVSVPVYSAAGVIGERLLFANALRSMHVQMTAARRKRMKCGLF
jgi:hypothetical protein